jgi:NTE family protein
MTRRWPLRSVALFIGVLLSLSAPAQTEPARPKVALVLSGGGARGISHVGVLRVLKDLHVPVDMVVGVSMGSVVGGAYAAGRSVEDLEDFVRHADWAAIVADRPARDDLAFRRREEDLLLPSRIEFSVTRDGVSLPPSAAGNAALESALTRLLPQGAAERPVDKLALPFRSVASDLLTGELVLLKDTPLFQAMRASLSVPGVFAPVRVDNRLVVDGGLVRNLPVDIARAMGAEIIIAVNVGTPLAPESELTSAIGVAQQMLQILTEQNVQRSLKELGPADILIAPDLTGISFMNFSRSEAAMAAGERAARLLAPRLERLAVPPAAYAALEQTRLAGPNTKATPLPIARLDVPATRHASADALKEQLGLHEGDVVSAADVSRAAARLHGRGDFERVEIDIRDVDGRREVRVKPTEAEWAHSRLRIGLELTSDFSDDNRFTFSALHVLSWLNPWGAELRTLARIGSERSIATQWWQPLAPGSDWYVAPALQYDASSADIFSQGQRALRLGYNFSSATLALGRQLSNWGDVQLGITRRVGAGRVLVPATPTVQNASFADTVYYTQLQVDTLDSLAFPSRGVLLQGRWEQSPGKAGSDSRARSSLLGLAAFRAGDWAGHLYGEWSKAQVGTAPLPLGGFLRLSGTARESVDGRTVLLGRVVLARRIGDMPTGLGGAVRIGMSLELGAGFAADQSVRFGDLKQAGSGFFSVDTRFGPLFLAAGATRGTGGTLYLFLGPFW